MAMPIDLTAIDLVEFRFSQLPKRKLRQSNDHCIEVNSGFNQSGHRDDILTIAKNKNNIEVAKAPFFIKKVFDTTTKLMLPLAECRSIN